MKLEMPEFQKAKLLVVGDIMLDRYWHGSASRVSPEAPVPVVCVDSREGRPGGAGNVALNISALGSAARLIGVVGKDETGQRCEIFELEGHPYYVGVQYHPEFKSRPEKPSPPVLGLLKAASGESM